jgi:hypothetical protein
MNSQTGHIGFAVQSGKGVYNTPLLFTYYENDDIGLMPENITPPAQIGGGRDVVDMYAGPMKVDGGMDLDPRPDFAGLPFYGVLGGISTAAGAESGVYVSTITPENTLPWLSAQRKVSDTYDVFNYTDLKINSMTLSCEAGQQVSMNLDIRGLTESGSASPETPTYETAQVWMWHSGTVELEGSEICVQSVSLEINNNLDDSDYRICSTYGRGLGDLSEGMREINATLAIRPSDNDLYQKAVYGQDNATAPTKSVYSGSLHLRFESVENIGSTSEKYYLDITIPKAFFQPFKISPNGSDTLEHELNMVAAKSGALDIITVEIQNTIADYTA